MKQARRVRLAILLGFLAALAPLSTDMYLPALPIMNAEFNVETSIIQMTLTMTMVGMAIGQLFAGPISDRFGRKIPLVIGMACFSLATFGCMTATNIVYFLIFRLIQGLSGSFGIVVARAIARDIYSGIELTKFISMLMLVNGFAPILAPIIGGQILLLTKWRDIFTALTSTGLLLMICSIRLEESLPLASRSKNTFASFTIFFKLMHDRYFVGHCIVQCTIFAAFFAYISGSPFLFQNIYHVSPQIYSFIFGGLGLCMVIAGLVPVFFAGRVTDIILMAWATGQALVASCLFMLCIVFHMTLIWIVISLIMLVTTIPIFGATSFSLSMRKHGKEAGAASALFGFSSMCSSGLVAPLVGICGSDTALPMALIILFGTIFTVLVFAKMIYWYHRRGYVLLSRQ